MFGIAGVYGTVVAIVKLKSTLGASRVIPKVKASRTCLSLLLRYQNDRSDLCQTEFHEAKDWALSTDLMGFVTVWCSTKTTNQMLRGTIEYTA